ncbi:24026_t:CDS:2, partial [Cetraspora pellucida]
TEEVTTYIEINQLANTDTNTLIDWPTIKDSPINEFEEVGYITKAFPTLFPKGKADLHSTKRHRRVYPVEYFEHLIKYCDGRFAQHKRFRYFALNSIMRWRALENGKIYVRQNLEDVYLTVEDIQELLNTNNSLQIGMDGLIFFTFSSADLHWPDLHNLMPNTSVSSTQATQYHNLNENPHIATWFFTCRFELFLEHVLIPKWNLSDYWYRYEWQHRGSTHVHGIGKVSNAPTFDWMAIQQDEHLMENIITYIDSIATAMNSDRTACISEQHPCQKPLEELTDDFDDYCQLVNKVQRHTKCSSSSCLVLNKRTNLEECRFGYPKELHNSTIIQSDDNNQPELLLRRNNPLVNPHCRIQLQGWRANVDIKPVLSLHAALSYIAKYASKSEPRSKTFDEIFSDYLNSARPDEPTLKPIQKLLLHTVSERNFSAQETSHLLLKLPLVVSSSVFLILDLSED